MLGFRKCETASLERSAAIDSGPGGGLLRPSFNKAGGRSKVDSRGCSPRLPCECDAADVPPAGTPCTPCAILNSCGCDDDDPAAAYPLFAFLGRFLLPPFVPLVV